VTAEAWATAANELCTQAALEEQVIGKPLSRTELINSFDRIDKYFRFFNPRLVALGWPNGKKAVVLELQGQYRKLAIVIRRAHKALKEGQFLRAVEILDEIEQISGPEPNKTFRKLGARVCASDSKKALKNAQGTDSLEWMLLRYRTVVVVFYSPNSSVDDEAVIEARAAALDTGAGFVAVNVKREAQVAALAIGYEVLDTPSVLVFVRGPKLKSHFSGIVDRVTVAQAVTNAR
jgi:predicted GTPase